MNCQEALSLLYEIIDKEASQINASQVEDHLSHCRHCSEIYRVEKSIHELILERLKHDQPTPRVEALKKSVLGELDAIDSKLRARGEVGAPAKGASFFRFGRYLAIAAALAVVVGGIYFGRNLADHSEVFVPLEQAHWTAVDSLDNYRNNSVTVAAMNAMDRNFDYRVEPEVGSFVMVGGKGEDIGGVRIAHFVYHNADKVVSTFLADAHLVAVPEELLDDAVVRDGVTFYDHNCRGCRLVYHQVGKIMVITATRDRDVDLLEFIPGRSLI